MPDEQELKPITAGLDLSLFGDEHVRQYEETDGENGFLWNGATCLILRTTGAKSGLPRKSALIYAAHTSNGADAYVLIASQGGAPTHPNWYHNLLAHPDCEVQVKGDVIPVRARTAEGAEREELRKLRRENRQLKLEREILAKATAWFARETNSIPPRDSSS